MSAADIAARVRAGELSAPDAVSAHLVRIREMEPRLGALSAVRADEALQEAEEVQRRSDLASLPLAGVPVGIKENVDVAGLPTLHGSMARSHTAAARDDELVRRLRAAGAVVVAKTHMPELAIWPVTEGALCNTRNPWQLQRTPGGSSGGSAAAVAAGMVALAQGTDGGGSIRIPAACCGLVGVKPTPGLVPLPGGAASHWYGLSAAGPITRTVDDAALMLDVLAGSDVHRDPQPPAEPLRVSLSWRHPLPGAHADAEMREAVKNVGASLRMAGHTVTAADPPYPAQPLAFVRCWLAGVAEDAEALRLDIARLEPRTRAIVRHGRRVRRWHRERQAGTFADAIALRAWMAQRDVLVAPVLASAPPPVGRWWGTHWLHMAFSSGRWMGYAPPWNLAGCPVVALPVAQRQDGLPIGVQLIGSPGSEVRLLSVAKQLETLLAAPR